MKKVWVFITACLLSGSCATSPEMKSFKGVITDATMNTITIVKSGNDTLPFSTMNADRTKARGLLVGDSLEVFYSGKYKPGMEASKIVLIARYLVGGNRDAHGCLTSAGYTWSEVQQNCVRLWEKGIRLEAVDGSRRSIYVLFSPDSLRAELFASDNEVREILDRRALPSGGHVWNVEDDDTKNLRYEEGCWTISQRGKLLYKQEKSDNDVTLGQWEELRYEGVLPAADCRGIKYQLSIRHREHSGDGSFLLTLTYLEAENGKDAVFTYTGSRNTQRGIPADKDATVWQLVSEKGEVFNFLYEDENTLTLLNGDFEKAASGLDYTLKRI